MSRSAGVHCERDVGCAFVDSWCDEVAQELQMPIGPQMLDDVEDARPATLKDPGTPYQIVMKQHSLTHFPSQPSARCASNLEDVIHRIENSRKSMQLCLNFSLTTGTWVTEAFCRLRASSWELTPLMEPSTRRWCPTPRRWTCLCCCGSSQVGASHGYPQHTENQRHELQPVEIRSFDVREETYTTI